MATISERFIAEINAQIFFREFSFSKNDFHPEPAKSAEFGDSVVMLDELMIIYQIKERGSSASDTEEAERKWFAEKVRKKATKQIRDTLNYLETVSIIVISNQLGHKIELNRKSIKRIINLVIYEASENLPVDCRRIRHHISSTVGFIHILSNVDYFNICRLLVTPAELEEYLLFREMLIRRNDDLSIREPAIVGQFLSGRLQADPSELFVEYIKKFRQDSEEFALDTLLSNFGEKIEKVEGANGTLDYYRILAELAKLNRNELKQFKLRFDYCLKVLADKEISNFTRFLSPRTECGFILFSNGKEVIDDRIRFLKLVTETSKYELRCAKHIGVLLTKDNDYTIIDWMFTDSIWEFNPYFEDKLANSYPFLPTRVARISKYNFD